MATVLAIDITLKIDGLLHNAVFTFIFVSFVLVVTVVVELFGLVRACVWKLLIPFVSPLLKMCE